MRGPGDPDGDGLLEYRPSGSRSLSNQSWKDSENAVQFPDGRLAEGPIAMVEVQGYAYRARRELAGVLRQLGEDREAAALDAEAEALRGLIREQYWCAGADGEPGFFALALDGRKRRVSSIASNMGHLLWCDVPSDQEAAEVARHLAGPELASGWGLRTLSGAWRGSTRSRTTWARSGPTTPRWPARGYAGTGWTSRRLGWPATSWRRWRSSTTDCPSCSAATIESQGTCPVPYPTACRPQAWAAGVPLQLATMFLGLEPHVPDGRVALRPALPIGLSTLEVRGIPLPGGPLSVRVDREVGTQILEAPADLVVELRAAGSARGHA